MIRFIKNIFVTRDSENQTFVNDFYYSTFALNILTVLWILYQLYIYFFFADRPIILFAPIDWFQQLLMPQYPSTWLYISVCISGIMLNLYSFKKSNIGIRSISTIIVLYINSFQWSFMYLSAVGYLFVLAHLMKIFIHHSKQDLDSNLIQSRKAIQWYYASLLITYSLAGFWKFVSLLYKIFLTNDPLHWLHPKAIFYTYEVSFRGLDDTFIFDKTFLTFQPFWQLAFLSMMLMQLLAIFCVFRKKWLYFAGIWFVLFHLVNLVLFKVVFYLATFTLLALFLPWQDIINFYISITNKKRVID